MAVSYSNMPSKELTAALKAARAAADVIGAHYRKNPSVRTKPDDSPVTEADVRAEEVIRATLSRHFPGYGFYGEETGRHAMEAERDRKSTRLNSSHLVISYAVFCLKKKNTSSH